jgi:hypothetical protein
MYEIFMHRAFRNSDNSKPGMHCSIIQNLVQIESGDTTFIKWHGSFEKQLDQAKKYMLKAMEKYLKMKKIPTENLARIEILKSHIELAETSKELINIIEVTNELTQCVKNY